MMHRDLKPSNIFFSLDGLIKVGDFGLVTSSTYGGLQNSYVTLKGLGEEQGGGQHTGNLGSHFYMSPEQVLGKKYNRKVDIFSLGIILFELHHPFATSMERAKVRSCDVTMFIFMFYILYSTCSTVLRYWRMSEIPSSLQTLRLLFHWRYICVYLRCNWCVIN